MALSDSKHTFLLSKWDTEKANYGTMMVSRYFFKKICIQTHSFDTFESMAVEGERWELWGKVLT